jgi:phage-Barnase-EndoU-ColicinE5/D-RelE like nuclease3
MNDEELLKKQLEALINLAKSDSNNNETIVFEANPEILEQMGDQFEKDLSGYNFQIDMYAIRHIFKEHTDAKKEESRGQIVINESDILLVFDVLNQPDLFFYDGKSRLGKDIFVFQKLIGNRYVIIKEVREGKKRIALHSMRIFKTKENQN